MGRRVHNKKLACLWLLRRQHQLLRHQLRDAEPPLRAARAVRHRRAPRGAHQPRVRVHDGPGAEQAAVGRAAVRVQGRGLRGLPRARLRRRLRVPDGVGHRGGGGEEDARGDDVRDVRRAGPRGRAALPQHVHGAAGQVAVRQALHRGVPQAVGGVLQGEGGAEEARRGGGDEEGGRAGGGGEAVDGDGGGGPRRRRALPGAGDAEGGDGARADRGEVGAGALRPRVEDPRLQPRRPLRAGAAGEAQHDAVLAAGDLRLLARGDGEGEGRRARHAQEGGGRAILRNSAQFGAIRRNSAAQCSDAQRTRLLR